MRFIVLLAALALTGCIGSATSHTVMGGKDVKCMPSEVRGDKLWWQKTTVGVSKADNPWEKFNQPTPARDLDDLWADFEEPALFTKEFIKREKAKRARDEAIKKRFRKMLERAFYPKEI